MTPEKYELTLTRSCMKYYRHGYFLSLAVCLGELQLASSYDIIGSEWRKRLPIHDIDIQLSANLDDIVAEWTERYERLKRIIDYGRSLGYEDMMQVLGTRSDLEFSRPWIGESEQNMLDRLDGELHEFLADNQAQCLSCFPRLGFWSKYPHFWWCRGIGENRETEVKKKKRRNK